MELLFNLKEEEQLQKLNAISKEVLMESWNKDLVSIDEVIDMAMDIIYKLREDKAKVEEELKDEEENKKYKSTEDQNYYRRGID